MDDGMVGARIRHRIETIVEAFPIPSPIAPDRVARIVMFCTTGVTGIGVDMVTTVSFLSATHYLIANTAGFIVAVSWNFVLNWWLTYDAPPGSIGRRYVGYVAVHGLSFGIRLVIVAILVEMALTSAPIAALVGILFAAALNFTGMEKIFEDAVGG